MIGGAIGSALRYAMSTWIAEATHSTFPWGTLAVNVLGSFDHWILYRPHRSRWASARLSRRTSIRYHRHPWRFHHLFLVQPANDASHAGRPMDLLRPETSSRPSCFALSQRPWGIALAKRLAWKALKLMEPAEQCLRLRVYAGESDQWERRPLYEAIVLKARQRRSCRARPSSEARWDSGQPAASTPRRFSILSTDLPIVVEIIDTKLRRSKHSWTKSGTNDPGRHDDRGADQSRALRHEKRES